MLKYIRAKFRPANLSHTAAPPTFAAIDPYSQAFIDSPYSALEQLHYHSPVHRCTSGSWLLSRHRDISAALADPRLSNTPSDYAVVNQRHRGRYTCADVANNTLPFMDAPQHTEARRSIARVFHEQLRRTSLQSNLPTDTPSDLLHDFATPLCAKTLCSLFGIAPRQQTAELDRQLKRWANWFFSLFSAIPSQQHRQQLDAELLSFRQFCSGLLNQKRQHPSNDLPSALAQLHDQTPRISDTFMADNCMLLFANGLNADYAIANALHCLLQQPEKIDQLRAKPELIAAAADELLRFDSPVLFIARRALEDVQLHDQMIKKNSGVLLMLAAANRDPDVFTDANTLNFEREAKPYLSFGRGQHGCIGRVLVKQLLELSLRWLISEAPHVALVRTQPLWQHQAGHRWLQDLPVKIP